MEENAGLLGVNARTVRRHINGEGENIDQLKTEKIRAARYCLMVIAWPAGFKLLKSNHLSR